MRDGIDSEPVATAVHRPAPRDDLGPGKSLVGNADVEIGVLQHNRRIWPPALDLPADCLGANTGEFLVYNKGDDQAPGEIVGPRDLLQ
jgi:hypothetical protein